MLMTREKATESPWFLVKGENLLVREVSFRLLLLALLNGPRTDQHWSLGCSTVQTLQRIFFCRWFLDVDLRVLSFLSARRDWSVHALDDVIRKRSFPHTFCLTELRRVPYIIALRDTVSTFALLLSGAPVLDMNSQQQRIFSSPHGDIDFFLRLTAISIFLCLTAIIDFFFASRRYQFFLRLTAIINFFFASRR